MPKRKSSHEYVWWDWRDQPEQVIRTALKRMGLFLYNDPGIRGSTVTGFIISKKKLDRKQVRKIAKNF